MTSTQLQASLEYLIGQHLEGKIQSGLIIGKWKEYSLLLGYYQPYKTYPGHRVLRRITGGKEAILTPNHTYLGLVFASENLEEVVETGEKLIECTGNKEGTIMGVTRIGPRPLATGVIEIIAELEINNTVHCVTSELFGKNLEVRKIMENPDLQRLTKPYEDPRWTRFNGIEAYPKKCSLRRGDYLLRLGASIVEGKYIGDMAIDGSFYAAPPNEPFNLVNTLAGMPITDQTIYAFEVRLGKQLELYGLGKDEVTCCFKRLMGLYDEEGPG